MHKNEITTTPGQVRKLLAQQFPHWSGLPITQLPISGTDHTLFRLGTELVARMPRIDWAADQAESDSRWLPVLAPHLPLLIPVPVAVGEPGEGFPWRWTVVPWMTGEDPTRENTDLERAAVDLAQFVLAMRRIETVGGPVKTGMTRGVPLAARDALTREAIAELGDRIDTRRVTAAWDAALAADVWTEAPVWIHGDLQPGNLLVHERRLSAVIDFGGLGLGDPAADLQPAWNLFDARSRVTFRKALGCDDAMWLRGSGWALSTALVALPYYWDTVPAFVSGSQARIAEVISEIG
jgi:aminoglycoside phosphotransferase (APT) family kinase protein